MNSTLISEVDESNSNIRVHLQVLLAVGLAIFCFCLLLGCILCWRRRKSRPSQDKEVVLCPPSTPVNQVVVAVGILPIKQQYEELEGDVLDYPPSPGSCTLSEDDLSALPCAPRPRSSSELREPLRTCFPMRRLSSPTLPCSAPGPGAHGHASLPSVARLGLVSRTRRVLDRRRTVTADSFLCTESSRLTGGSAPRSPSAHPPGLQGEPPPPLYGSSSSSSPVSVPSKPAPLLHFTLLFSPAAGTLTVTVLGLSGGARRQGGVFVRASLPPLCPAPRQVSTRRRSLSAEFQPQSLVLTARSADELRACTLMLTVYTRDFSGLREAALGELELPCAEMDWQPDMTITCTRELSPTRRRLKKSMSSQEALGSRRASLSAPRALGQLFILLQYQTLAHRIKVMVRKAENLAKLNRMPGAPDHYVIINLRQGGKVINTKETKGAGGHNAVWNAPFLFDLPRGDVTQLPLVLEFIVMQGRLYTKSSILGHVLIGYDGPEAGRSHWRDMCSRGQVETARWHTIQAEPL